MNLNFRDASTGLDYADQRYEQPGVAGCGQVHDADVGMGLNPCNRPKGSTISDERKGNKDVEVDDRNRSHTRGALLGSP